MFLKPDYNLESIYDIDILELKKKGIRVLFFDLDSTVMKSRSGKFAFKTLQFLNDLRTNFQIAIVSNNRSENYIKKAKSQIDIPFFYKAKKPNPKVLFQACRELMAEPSKCAIIGDRPLSDILGGINAGMTTILVDSISKEEENFIVRFARFLERLTIKKEQAAA